MVILAPIAAMLIQFAISRQREFKADAVGAQISGRPRSLANALLKLEAGAHRISMNVAPAVAPLAQVTQGRSLEDWLSDAQKLLDHHGNALRRLEPQYERVGQA